MQDPSTDTDAADTTPAPHRGRGRGPKPRMLGHGDLRLLLLALLEPQPRHGYELIHLIGDIFRGQYMPSAGATYPALAQLEEDGLVQVRQDGNRRLHALTAAGRAYIETHADELAQARLRTERSARSMVKAGLPSAVRTGMAAVKRSLLVHHRDWSPVSGQAVAEILLRAAEDISRVPRG
ncbi:PadR family transcriptional regulator [Luteimonas lutimaris]|uniref:PadR family transcriptional regulator n=1 Tax=Luteimonas lutimaris TaxID=698645 RepID=A0ABP7MG98_9GAMM